MNTEKILKIYKTRLFRKGVHSFRLGHPKKNPQTLDFQGFEECWWPDLNRHGVAPEGF